MSSFENFIYRSNERVYALARLFSYLNTLAAIIIVVYRYGFFLNAEEYRKLMLAGHIVLGIYVVLFALRVLFAYNRAEYLRSERVEGSFLLFILLHGLLQLFFKFKFLLYYLHLFSIPSAERVYGHLVMVTVLALVLIDTARASAGIPEMKVKPATSFIMGFLMLILSGAVLLSLPAMRTAGNQLSVLDALFTSVSASCVTGLIVVDTGTFFTHKGHWVLLILIQIGGLGIVLFATFVASFLSKGIGLKQQSLMQDHLSSESLASAKKLLRRIIFLTLLIESVGAVFIFFSWEDELASAKPLFNSVSEKIFFSVFHSVSAFCNAGFSLFSDGYFSETKGLRYMYQLHFFTAIIVIFGSMGFTAIEDVFSPTKIRARFSSPWKHWQMSTRITLYASAVFVVVGTVAFMVLEFDKLTDRTIVEALITSFFQSVVTRTAGFNTMDFASLQVPTIILCIFFMFIGANSGSTGGGIKINTFMVIFLSALGNVKGQKNVNIYGRQIPEELISRAYTLLMFAFTYNSIAIFFLAITDGDKEILPLAFEHVSAFCTVGLSMGITDSLSPLGKVIIMISMFIGRVGLITLALSLSSPVKTNSYKYPRAYMMIG